MKKYIGIIILISVLVITSPCYSQPTIFTDIKNEAMKVKPDSDGDYVIQVEKGRFVYMVGYVQKTIGCTKFDKETYNQLIILYDEEKCLFFSVTTSSGMVSIMSEISENEAVIKAKKIFNEFRLACNMQTL